MNIEEFEKALKNTVSPIKTREALIGSEFLSDVKFILGGQQEELKAHKFFLVTASPVFHEIFTDQSNSDEASLIIKISDISKSTMIEVCRFAYCSNVRFNHHNMVDILVAAKKLRMNFLADKAINYIGKEGMNEHTVFNILEANQKERDTFINMKCFAYIEKNHQKCFMSNKFFLEISSELVRMVLQGCKLPQATGRYAIDLWSSYPGNGSEDIDELYALVHQ